MQGICSGLSEMFNKGLLVAKAVVTCTHNHLVLVKLMNPGNEQVYVNKGILASFKLCDNTIDIISLSNLSYNNIQLPYRINTSEDLNGGLSNITA